MYYKVWTKCIIPKINYNDNEILLSHFFIMVESKQPILRRFEDQHYVITHSPFESLVFFSVAL